MEKISYGIVFTIEKLRYYLLYCTTFIVSLVNPLRYLVDKQDLSGRVTKWLILLQDFDINVVKKKLVKGQAIIDLIAEFSQNEDVVVHEEFLYIF